jgi:hypothetical protein
MNLRFAGSSMDKQFMKARRFGERLQPTPRKAGLTPTAGRLCQSRRTGRRRGTGILDCCGEADGSGQRFGLGARRVFSGNRPVVGPLLCFNPFPSWPAGSLAARKRLSGHKPGM